MDRSKFEFVQVASTVDSQRIANKVADELLGKRLASCVQIFGPVDSRYWWNGKLEHSREWVCLIKAKARDYPRIESAIKRIHPYDIPEIIAFSISQGNPEYLDWIRRETTGKLRRQD